MRTASPEPLLLSARKAADYLGIGRTKLLALAKEGQIEFGRLDNGDRYFSHRSLERFAAELLKRSEIADKKRRH